MDQFLSFFRTIPRRFLTKDSALVHQLLHGRDSLFQPFGTLFLFYTAFLHKCAHENVSA